MGHIPATVKRRQEIRTCEVRSRFKRKWSAVVAHAQRAWSTKIYQRSRKSAHRAPPPPDARNATAYRTPSARLSLQPMAGCELRTNERTQQQTNKQTNKHDGWQYLLAEVMNELGTCRYCARL